MGSAWIDHDDAWTTDGTLNGTTAIASGTAPDGGNGASSAAISLDGFDGVIVSVSVGYGATATEGLKVWILGDVDGTNYQTVADGVYGIELARAASSVRTAVLTVSAEDHASIKVRVSNNSGSSVSPTVRWKRFKRSSA